MNNMLIRPTPDELANFGEPDFIIYNAGQFPANRFTTGMTSTTSVEINFKRMEMVILGCVRSRLVSCFSLFAFRVFEKARLI
jgi:phosphoenolpyruvate carboxykinase (ATP)